jgi:hypothetical protein
MLETLETPATPDTTAYTAMLRQELAANSRQSAKILQVHMQSAQSFREASMRQQLESMLMHAERSLANEESSRTLSSLFGKFTLLQKIMQTMG